MLHTSLLSIGHQQDVEMRWEGGGWGGRRLDGERGEIFQAGA